MNDFSSYEKQIAKHLSSAHSGLLPLLSPKERRSMQQNVNAENIETIQAWIGTDQEIGDILFWDCGDKFDDPRWQRLKPIDDVSAELYNQASRVVDRLKETAIDCQRRSDLTLFSQFNSGLLFSGIAGAVRCDGDGSPKRDGEFFRGVELRCIGSVGTQTNTITLYPLEDGDLEIHLGGRRDNQPAGILVYTGDNHSLLQLAQLVTRGFPKIGLEATVTHGDGKVQQLDPKVIRKALMSEMGANLSHGSEMRLFAARHATTIDLALDIAEKLSRTVYERFGLEIECYKIGKLFPNFVIMRDENTDTILPPSKPVSNRGLVLITATNICRRCRRELKGFRDFARNYPEVTFALVNLSSPQFKFYERVFGDMGDGDPDRFRKTASGVTPFIIIYAPDQNGILKFAEYYSTGKAQDTPAVESCIALFDRYFK